MKRFVFFLFTILFALAVPPRTAQAQDMPERHRKWVEEEVRWIITKEERAAFFKLDTNELRDHFIEIFWDKRDPTPGTRTNEFKDEHYKRIEYANKFFGPRGRDTGWRSERGRIYIMFGPPKERLEFPFDALVYPVELWFYSGDNRISTASFFYVMFFKKGAAGDFEIYHPKLDGPGALTWKGNFDISDSEIMEALQILHPEVARAAISLNPLDPENSLSSEVLLSQIDSWPERAIDSSWATDFLNSRGKVEVTYSFRQIANLTGHTLLFTPPDGRQQLHWSIMVNPEDLDIGEHEGAYYAVFEFMPSLADSQGNIIWEKAVTTELNWNEEMFQQYRKIPLMFADVLPIIPGDYTFTLRVRNKVSKSFFMFVRSLSIPQPGSDQFLLTPPMLSHGYDKVTEENANIAPFRIFNIDYHASTTNTFASVDNVHLFTELHYQPPTGTTAHVGEIRFLFNVYDDKNALVKQMTHIIPRERVNPYGVIYMSRQIPVNDLPMGKYRLEVKAEENLANQNAARALDFVIADPAVIRRPTVLALRRSEKLNTQTMFLARGDQLVKAGMGDAAMVEYGNALKLAPGDIESATKLAELMLEKRRIDDAYNLVRGVEPREPNNRAIVSLLARISAAKGNYEQAARYYQRLLFVNEKDIEILNLTGAMFDKAGNKEQAKVHYQKSLALNAEQPEIKQLLEAL